MSFLLTAAQMRANEARAMKSGAVQGIELMERAGQGVLDAIFRRWPEIAGTSGRALILCGPGNNGGDGFVVARLLHDRGWDVDVRLFGDIDKLPPDARTNADRWIERGRVTPWSGWTGGLLIDPVDEHQKPVQQPTNDPWQYTLIVDALFGIGLTRPLDQDKGFSARLPEWDLRDEPNRPRIVAIDIPSGLHSDTGHVPEGGDVLWADLTVTFHAMKSGHMLADGPFYCGTTVVADIGLKDDESEARLVDAPTINLSKTPQFAPSDKAGHKFSYGHALILSGNKGKCGASRMSARAALRVGAGLVTLGCPEDALAENAAHLDAIMLEVINDAATLTNYLKDDRLNAIGLGPALGTSDREEAIVAAVLDANRATVVDADALTLVAKNRDLFANLHPKCVLTPHGGEFARLFPDLAEDLKSGASKIEVTQQASHKANCTVLLKGADTVIASPDGQTSVHAAVYDRAAPWLATAGSGDVLSGLITGCLARGAHPHQAAETGAWLHTEAALAFGPGLIAEDLPDQIPQVLRKLGA